MSEGVRDRITELVRVRAGDLVANPSNWRRHPRRQRAALQAMLEEIGYANALLTRRDGESLVLIDGHLRKSLDPDQMVPVLVLDVTAAEADALLLTLDPIGALARPDPESLTALLERVRFSGDAVADVLEELARSAALPTKGLTGDLDHVPDPGPTRSQPGDLWELGAHRLHCGDARRPEVLAELLGGHSPDLLLTDPPYGVSYTGKTQDALTISGDDAAGLPALLAAVFSRVDEVLVPGAPLYVFSPAGPGHLVFLQAFIAQGWRYHQGLVWAKNSPVIGHSDYHFQHEPILFGYRSSERARGRGRGGWYGGHDQTSLLEVPRPSRSTEHPTAKPVELLRRLISNSSRRGQSVLDPFAGSGSGLVACELLGRRFFGIEIDPIYCDVTIARYESLTGSRARRIEGSTT